MNTFKLIKILINILKSNKIQKKNKHKKQNKKSHIKKIKKRFFISSLDFFP